MSLCGDESRFFSESPSAFEIQKLQQTHRSALRRQGGKTRGARLVFRPEWVGHHWLVKWFKTISSPLSLSIFPSTPIVVIGRKAVALLSWHGCMPIFRTGSLPLFCSGI